MENPEVSVSIDEIKNLTSEEFKKKILEWIDEKGISEQLHSRLRHDLFENFNKTALGRRIEAQYQSEYRMILSPLILALNTMVAEFLYAQNCHYSLSVFCAEVPFKNTLPEFEKHEYFRFNKSELNDIFEAVGVQRKSELSETISSSYFKNNNKGNNSLLYFLLKHLFTSLLSVHQKITLPSGNNVDAAIPDIPTNIKPHRDTHLKCEKCTQSSSLHSRNIKYLNKFLMSMTKKIKEISKKMDKMEIKNSNYTANEQQRQHHVLLTTKEKSVENLENLNKSLEKLTQEIRQTESMSQSGKDGDQKSSRQFSEIIKSINGLSEKFEACTKNFTALMVDREKVQVTVEKEIRTEYSSYGDWLKDFKDSKYGLKFLKKLESTYMKSMEKEKENLEKSFNEKLSKEKSLIKLYYRQKFLEQLNLRLEDSKATDTQRELLKELFEKNFKIFENREKEMNVAEESIKNQYKIEIEEKKIQKIQDEQEMKAAKKINLSLKHNVANINIEPVVQQKIIESEFIGLPDEPIERFDPNPVEYLVMDAKKRLLDLEKESELLDQSFQSYLQRQMTEKTKHKMDVSQILKNYDLERKVLSISTYQTMPFTKNESDLYNSHTVLNTDQKIEKIFENPFKGFDPQKLLANQKTNKSAQNFTDKFNATFATIQETSIKETAIANEAVGVVEQQKPNLVEETGNISAHVDKIPIKETIKSHSLPGELKKHETIGRNPRGLSLLKQSPVVEEDSFQLLEKVETSLVPIDIPNKKTTGEVNIQNPPISITQNTKPSKEYSSGSLADHSNDDIVLSVGMQSDGSEEFWK